MHDSMLMHKKMSGHSSSRIVVSALGGNIESHATQELKTVGLCLQMFSRTLLLYALSQCCSPRSARDMGDVHRHLYTTSASPSLGGLDYPKTTQRALMLHSLHIAQPQWPRGAFVWRCGLHYFAVKFRLRPKAFHAPPKSVDAISKAKMKRPTFRLHPAVV